MEFLGDPYCNVWPLDRNETAESAATAAAADESSPSQCNTFLITITAKFTRPCCNSDEQEEEEDYENQFFGAELGPSITFTHTFTLPLAVLTGGEARDNVAKMLSDVHVPTTHRFILDKILDTGREIANDRPGISVKIDAFVDQLPVPSEDDYLMEDDDEEDDGDYEVEIDGGGGDEDDNDYVVRFVPASKESIEGLREMRVEISENSETCPVCLDDVPVGFEAIRLPCSHLYHGDCIVKWLQTSKICPVCRFEMS